MNINIDYSKREPIYEQIVKEVEKQITLGILEPGYQVPSVRALAYDLGINPNTVKKAYDILEENGLIISKSTKGTFISDNIKKAKELKIEELIERLNEIKKELENKIISFQVKTGVQDKVFGKVSTKQISEKLKKMGYSVDKKCIKLDNDLDVLGIHEVEVVLHKKVIFKIRVNLQK